MSLASAERIAHLEAELEASHVAEREGLIDAQTLMARIRVLEAGSPRRGAQSRGFGAMAAETAQRVPCLSAAAITFVGERQQARNDTMEALHHKLDAERDAVAAASGVAREQSLARAKALSSKLEVVEYEFTASLRLERVNRAAMEALAWSSVDARARYAQSMVEQRLDSLGAIVRTLKRAHVAEARRGGGVAEEEAVLKAGNADVGAVAPGAAWEDDSAEDATAESDDDAEPAYHQRLSVD